MKIEDFLTKKSVFFGLNSMDKEGVLLEMVDILVDRGLLPATLKTDSLEALILRENLGSTGTGRGVAFPHARIENLENLVGLFAYSEHGVEFDAIDGEPVFLYFCLFSPKDESTEHVAALSRVAKIVRNADWCKFLKQAKSSEEIHNLLLEAEEEIFS